MSLSWPKNGRWVQVGYSCQTNRFQKQQEIHTENPTFHISWNLKLSTLDILLSTCWYAFLNTWLFSRVAKILSSKWLSMGPWKPNRPPIVTSREWTIVYFGMLPVEYTNWRGRHCSQVFPSAQLNCQVPAPLVSRLPAACGIVVAGASEITGNQQETHVAKWQWGSVTYHDIFGGQMAQKIIVQISAVLKHIPHFERTPSSTRQFHHHVVFTAILTVGGRQLWSRKHQRS